MRSAGVVAKISARDFMLQYVKEVREFPYFFLGQELSNEKKDELLQRAETELEPAELLRFLSRTFLGSPAFTTQCAAWFKEVIGAVQPRRPLACIAMDPTLAARIGGNRFLIADGGFHGWARAAELAWRAVSRQPESQTAVERVELGTECAPNVGLDAGEILLVPFLSLLPITNGAAPPGKDEPCAELLQRIGAAAAGGADILLGDVVLIPPERLGWIRSVVNTAGLRVAAVLEVETSLGTAALHLRQARELATPDVLLRYVGDEGAPLVDLRVTAPLAQVTLRPSFQAAMQDRRAGSAGGGRSERLGDLLTIIASPPGILDREVVELTLHENEETLDEDGGYELRARALAAGETPSKDGIVLNAKTHDEARYLADFLEQDGLLEEYGGYAAECLAVASQSVLEATQMLVRALLEERLDLADPGYRHAYSREHRAAENAVRTAEELRSLRPLHPRNVIAVRRRSDVSALLASHDELREWESLRDDCHHLPDALRSLLEALARSQDGAHRHTLGRRFAEAYAIFGAALSFARSSRQDHDGFDAQKPGLGEWLKLLGRKGGQEQTVVSSDALQALSDFNGIRISQEHEGVLDASAFSEARRSALGLLRTAVTHKECPWRSYRVEAVDGELGLRIRPQAGEGNGAQTTAPFILKLGDGHHWYFGGIDGNRYRYYRHGMGSRGSGRQALQPERVENSQLIRELNRRTPNARRAADGQPLQHRPLAALARRGAL